MSENSTRTPIVQIVCHHGRHHSVLAQEKAAAGLAAWGNAPQGKAAPQMAYSARTAGRTGDPGDDRNDDLAILTSAPRGPMVQPTPDAPVTYSQRIQRYAGWPRTNTAIKTVEIQETNGAKTARTIT